MCLDPCADASNCDVPKTPFDCRLNAGDTTKRCSPPAGVKCVAAAEFVRGKKAPGACCDFANGQAGGAECASHVCGSFGDNLPYVCTSRCESDVDCLANYKCEISAGSGSFISTCLPRAVFTGGSYTCK